MEKTRAHSETSRLIDELGGTVKLAALCDVSPSAVAQWKVNGIPLLRYQLLKIRFPKANWSDVKVARRSARHPRETITA